MNSFKLIFDVCIILSFLHVSARGQTIFECHGDFCNVGKEQQFCSSAFKLCRDCNEIKEDCGTPAQPLNCSGYCQEMAVAEALNEIREIEEKSCLVVPTMLNIANGYVTAPHYNNSRILTGSELVYNCDKGYALQGPKTIACIGNGTWSQTSLPYCFDSASIENSCLVVPIMLNIANGHVIVSHYNNSRIPTGAELVYSCDNGFTIEGPGSIVCTGNGTWSQTYMPYCLDRAWIGFKHLAIVFFILFIMSVLGLAGIILFCYRIRRNKKNLSRSSTDNSLHKEEEPLIDAESQSVHQENESHSTPMGAYRWEQSTDEETRRVSASAAPSSHPAESHKENEDARRVPTHTTPSAPPAGSNKGNGDAREVPTPSAPSAPPVKSNKEDGDGNRSDNKSRSSTEEPKVPGIVVNNQVHVYQTIISDTSMPPANGNVEEKANKSPYDPTRMDNKSIDEKMSTEESDEVDVVEETADEKKRRGTKPLPARDADSKTRAKSTQEMYEVGKEAKGPEPVPAEEEGNIQSPTTETGEINMSDKVGFQNVTFPKTDIHSNETRGKSTKEMSEEGKEAKGPEPVSAEEEGNIQSPTTETREGNMSDKVGFQNVTFPKNDVRSNATRAKSTQEMIDVSKEDKGPEPVSAEEEGIIQSPTTETGESKTSDKVGFQNVTFPKNI